MNFSKFFFFACFCLFLVSASAQISQKPIVSVDAVLSSLNGGTTYDISANFSLQGSVNVPMDAMRKVVITARIIDDHEDYNIQPWKAKATKGNTLTVVPSPNDPYTATITCILPYTNIKSEAQVMLVAGGNDDRCNYYDIVIDQRGTYIEYEDMGARRAIMPNVVNYSSSTCNSDDDLQRHRLANSSKTKAYPNPAINAFQVESPVNSRLRILSSNGQLMHEASTTNRQTSIDTSNWPSGIYFISILNKETNELEQLKLSVIH